MTRWEEERRRGILGGNREDKKEGRVSVKGGDETRGKKKRKKEAKQEGRKEGRLGRKKKGRKTD